MATRRPKIKQITPVLLVDAIEPVLGLWEGQLGFERVAEVTHEGRLGFVIFARDGAQVMLQTRASLEVDLPKVAEKAPTSVLYVDVQSLATTAAAVEGATVVVPERTTSYGAREIWIQDSAGQIIGFAQQDR
jgi:hypothetical protein